MAQPQKPLSTGKSRKEVLDGIDILEGGKDSKKHSFQLRLSCFVLRFTPIYWIYRRTNNKRLAIATFTAIVLIATLCAVS